MNSRNHKVPKETTLERLGDLDGWSHPSRGGMRSLMKQQNEVIQAGLQKAMDQRVEVLQVDSVEGKMLHDN